MFSKLMKLASVVTAVVAFYAPPSVLRLIGIAVSVVTAVEGFKDELHCVVTSAPRLTRPLPKPVTWNIQAHTASVSQATATMTVIRNGATGTTTAYGPAIGGGSAVLGPDVTAVGVGHGGAHVVLGYVPAI